MNASILIIDDDDKLCKLLTKYLGEFGLKTQTANTPSTGLEILRKEDTDLIILDIMLPEMDGFSVLREIRKTRSVPVIMLTARGDLTDKIVGLELGADDYLPKPFEPRELVARIQSVLRRTTAQPEENSILTLGNLSIDALRHKAMLSGKLLELTTNEFNALLLLVKNPGKVLSRDDILQELRGIDCDAFNRSVDITMSRLRQKLGDCPKNPQYIKTIWGTGYMFIEAEDK